MLDLKTLPEAPGGARADDAVPVMRSGVGAGLYRLPMPVAQPAAVLTSASVTAALGYTPYSVSNPAGYLTASTGVTSVNGQVGAVTVSAGTGTAGVGSFNGRTGAVSLGAADVSGALNFTPYSNTNPSGYITSAGAPVQSVNGQTGAVTLPAGVGSFNTRNGAVTLTSADVTGALGFAPYPSTNPFGYQPVADRVADAEAVALGGADVDVRRYGVVGDGVADDTAAMQRALDSGLNLRLPAGRFLLRRTLLLTTTDQRVTGAGRTRSVFLIDRTFTDTVCVIRVAVAGANQGTGPSFRDLGLLFDQPADLNVNEPYTYPAAFRVEDTSRVTWRGIRIGRGTNGIVLHRDCGDALMEDVEFGCYAVNLNIDGARDTVRVSRCHFWPFSAGPNQYAPFFKASCIGIRTYRCDDLKVSDCLIICCLSFQCHQGGIPGYEGSTFGTIINCGFDTFGGFQMTAGWLTVSNCMFTLGSNSGYRSQYGVAHDGGTLILTGCWFRMFDNPVINAFVLSQATGADGSAPLNITGCTFDFNGNPGIMGSAVGIYGEATALTMAGCVIHTNSANTMDSIQWDRGSGTVSGVKFAPLELAPQTAGRAITAHADRPYAVTGCDFGGRRTAFGTGTQHALTGNIRNVVD